MQIDKIAIAQDSAGNILYRIPTSFGDSASYELRGRGPSERIGVHTDKDGLMNAVCADGFFPAPWIRWIGRYLYRGARKYAYGEVALFPDTLRAESWEEVSRIISGGVVRYERELEVKINELSRLNLEMEIRDSLGDLGIRRRKVSIQDFQRSRIQLWTITTSSAELTLEVYRQSKHDGSVRVAYIVYMKSGIFPSNLVRMDMIADEPSAYSSETRYSLIEILKATKLFAPTGEVDAWFEEHTPKGVKWIMNRQGLEAYSLLGLESPLVGPWDNLVEWHNAQTG